mmetsp:Transcript_76245/g.176943  ORF Transcript_76245/g.176943 Transcript_76245/m.176943 type:complete len:206 (+) Transcript_76245:1037-1654(+)
MQEVPRDQPEQRVDDAREEQIRSPLQANDGGWVVGDEGDCSEDCAESVDDCSKTLQHHAPVRGAGLADIGEGGWHADAEANAHGKAYCSEEAICLHGRREQLRRDCHEVAQHHRPHTAKPVGEVSSKQAAKGYAHKDHRGQRCDLRARHAEVQPSGLAQAHGHLDLRSLDKPDAMSEEVDDLCPAEPKILDNILDGFAGPGHCSG